MSLKVSFTLPLNGYPGETDIIATDAKINFDHAYVVWGFGGNPIGRVVELHVENEQLIVEAELLENMAQELPIRGDTFGYEVSKTRPAPYESFCGGAGHVSTDVAIREIVVKKDAEYREKHTLPPPVPADIIIKGPKP